jgi:glutathione S-transferase
MITYEGYTTILELSTGEILTETALLLQYVADQAPQKNLIPPFGTLDRYRCMEWLNYVATELHKGVGVLFGDLPTDFRAETMQRIHQKLEFVNNTLAKGGYLMGNTFTVADIYLFTVLRWAPMVKLELTNYANIQNFMQNLAQRNSAKEAIAADNPQK